MNATTAAIDFVSRSASGRDGAVDGIWVSVIGAVAASG